MKRHGSVIDRKKWYFPIDQSIRLVSQTFLYAIFFSKAFTMKMLGIYKLLWVNLNACLCLSRLVCHSAILTAVIY